MSACIPDPAMTISTAIRGKIVVSPTAISLGVFALPTDPIGTTSVTFTGVNAGSEIRVYLPDTTELAGVESCANNQVLMWNVYASGSANNTVRIVIIHPDYKIKEFTYLSQTGNQSIPVQQEPDKWYSNPV